MRESGALAGDDAGDVPRRGPNRPRRLRLPMTRYLISRDASDFTRRLEAFARDGFRVRRVVVRASLSGGGPACFARLERGALGLALAWLASLRPRLPAPRIPDSRSGIGALRG